MSPASVAASSATHRSLLAVALLLTCLIGLGVAAAVGRLGWYLTWFGWLLFTMAIWSYFFAVAVFYRSRNGQWPPGFGDG
jgi:hypothetical protein